jgi:hypothetical protein
VNYMQEAFAPAEAKYKAAVMAATWGHLEPEPRVEYRGDIVFTHGEYGDIVVIRTRLARPNRANAFLPTEELPGSPGYFDDEQTFVSRQRMEQGRVYKWTGKYVRFKNGRCRFSGVTKEVTL